MAKTIRKDGSSIPKKLQIKNFAHINNVDLSFGDLTVIVGPQGAGKSLALQWLKIALDGKQVVDALRSAGHPTDRSEVLIDLIFGAGMSKAWKTHQTSVSLGKSEVSLRGISQRGSGKESLFFVPAHRSILISDGWATPFQKLSSETPAVARLFSQNLFEQFTGKDAKTLFPVKNRLKSEVREKIDHAVFHGGAVGIEEDAQHASRLRLVHGDMHLPFMTWTAGQREFTPLLMGLYHLLPSTKITKRDGIDWIVIEEPEMGLHPQAITAVLLLVLDLLWRGYRVVISTHSPYVLSMLWMMKILKEYKARWQLVCQAFGVKTGPMQQVAKSALDKNYKAFLFEFTEEGKVNSVDISDLDPGSEDERVSGWGGLTAYSSRFAEVVRTAVNESDA